MQTGGHGFQPCRTVHFADLAARLEVVPSQPHANPESPQRVSSSTSLVCQKYRVNHMNHAIRLEDIRDRNRRNITLIVF